MAALSVRTRSPCCNTGILCFGLRARNSGVLVSPLRDVMGRLKQIDQLTVEIPVWDPGNESDLEAREAEEPLFDLAPYQQPQLVVPEERITLPGTGEGLQRAIEAILEREESSDQNDTPE